MKPEIFNIDELLIRILTRQAHRDDIIYFSKWMEEGENRVYFEKFKKVWNLSTGEHVDLKTIEARLKDYRQFMQRSLKPKRNTRWMWPLTSVAAALLMGVFTLLHLQEPEKEILPGAKVHAGGVRLTLSDGKNVNVLSDSLQVIGKVENSVKIHKTNSREIIYKTVDSLDIDADYELVYNQLIVPAGERFSVQLSDGTKVWINSESSLRYPTRFGKGKREVEVRGNVYFEVKKDTAHPFIVVSPKMTTEVLGTRFEVNTYEDQNQISAILVDGSVRVNIGKHSVIMKPNQQIVYNINNQDFNLSEVNAAHRVRWKDGVLVIDNEQFEHVIWKLERWYGVSILNNTGVQFTQSFSGEFDREDIQAAIKALCINLNISYVIEGEQIILKK